ncbi:hypothetical protein J2S19_000617 [Metabacillus malikii]|uniref:Uncharacterized protein n=1 Tax=Metabacillus malikii TaxID=1504265 RepID=A0ABT9ZAU1_9BACI|nr:hypothetical protein [Metabacillus malikii]
MKTIFLRGLFENRLHTSDEDHFLRGLIENHLHKPDEKRLPQAAYTRN